MNKTYEPKNFEDAIYANWLQKKYFSAKVDKDKKPFTIVIPPPNITGQLHMGHALNNTIQDTIIRYKRMKGYEALWLPGTDHASIATEVKIIEKLREEGLSKEKIGRDGFLKRAYEWKDQYGGRIVEQLKKMGFSCDWDRLAFTMDENCSKAVRHVFVKLYNKGLIYRGSRIINWCPCCKTAISDAEVEYETEKGNLWHVRYNVKDSNEYIVVATTRPETMLGDTAVAVNPDDKRYSHLVGKTLILPLVNREIPIVADKYVDKAFGTGAVKITPAHDPNDFEVGLRHNLSVIRVMNDDGTMADNAGEYRSLDRYDARKKIVEDLQKLGLLVKIESHEHNVGHCYRCHNSIEPIVSKQWFVKMEPLAIPAISAVKEKKINFLPKRFEKIYLHWMQNIRDWCISRQLWWGHRIPAFYCECGHVEVSETDVDVCPKCGKKMVQDDDVLDTWFSSALWPFSTLGYPNKTKDLEYFYPTSLLVTAYDIIFFWVARMIFSGIEHMQEVPFNDVLFHGIVRDKIGRKMSKSLGNGIDPLEIIDTFGADSLRYSLVGGISAGNDVKYSEEKLEGYRNFMNKIWNAARFVLMNCEGATIKELSKVKTDMADKWILTRLSEVTARVTKAFDRYEVGAAASAVYDFVWNELCDWYIELAKTKLYSTDTAKRNDCISVLVYVLRETLKLMHPIAPFITQEIYSNLPNRDADDVMISKFPDAKQIKASKKSANEMQLIMDAIKAVRVMRQEMNVPQSKRTALYIVANEGYTKLINSSAGYIEKLAMGNKVEFSRPQVKCACVTSAVADIYIPMGELIDFSAEIERLKKELATCEAEISRANGKLNNAGFTAKAPPSLIEAEREKLNKWNVAKQKIIASIDEMSNN